MAVPKAVWLVAQRAAGWVGKMVARSVETTAVARAAMTVVPLEPKMAANLVALTVVAMAARMVAQMAVRLVAWTVERWEPRLVALMVENLAVH
jgi:hypothetical protein